MSKTFLLHSILASVTILAWLHLFFLAPLKEEMEEMNQQQLDPTEIVLIPIDITRVLVFVLGITFFSIVRSNHMLIKLYNIIYATIILFLCMILCGAPPDQNLAHTLLAAWHISALGTMNIDDPKLSTEPSLLQRLKAEDTPSLSSVIIAQATLAGTVPAIILRLYDNGWQIQRWPVPAVLGSVYGWVVGVLVAAVVTSGHQKHSKG